MASNWPMEQILGASRILVVTCNDPAGNIAEREA
jgi:hypothetical protein